MLLQFNFENFKSFKDETSLDLTAAKISEFPSHVISEGNEKVLLTTAIYGANASGKSNVYDAFYYMRHFVLHSFAFGGDDHFNIIKPTPFLFDHACENKESSFEVFFIMPDDSHQKTYNYGFSVDHEGIKEEWLTTKAKTSKNSRLIFYRSRKELDLSGLPKSAQNNLRAALENQVLIVSLGAKLKIEICKKVFQWFSKNQMANFANPVENYYLAHLLPKDFVNSAAVQKNVIDYFSSFDNSIKGFEIEELPGDDERSEKKYRILSLHKKKGSSKMVKIPLQNESSGTLKMFALYPKLQEVLNDGSVYFIDELNARLHPLIVRNFILIFQDERRNPHHAQLIFTTHDTWQLSNDLLRRDEIWFTDKDDEGVSTLYSLADFVNENGHTIRKDADFEKNYLIGKYGAIPKMNKIDIVKDHIKNGKEES